MKVIAIHGNYGANDKNFLPQVSILPDSAILFSNRPFFVPEFAAQFIAHTSLVVRIDRLGKSVAKRFAPRYYNAVAAGITVEARNVKCYDAAGAAPCALATSFDGSVMLGDFIPVDELESRQPVVSTFFNGEVVDTLYTSQLTMGIDELIEHVSRFFTLKTGDLIFTGHTSTEPELVTGTRLTAKVDDRDSLLIRVK